MGERSIEDRMGEALRCHQSAYPMTPWSHTSEHIKGQWRDQARVLLGLISRSGLRIAVRKGDKGDE